MSDDDQLKILSDWLQSYRVHELLNKEDRPNEFIKESVLRILPERVDRRLGMIKESYAGYIPLDVPDFEPFGDDSMKEMSAMKALASECLPPNQIYALCLTFYRIPRCCGGKEPDHLQDIFTRRYL